MEDIEYHFAEGTHSDLKLPTKSETFHIHKAIFCARSPVFRKIFATDMKEKIQECVDIPDLEADTLRRMLLYMYINTMENSQWEIILKLYAA
ncbi:hypothetical protein NPIL_320301 [Nephila pilipes]|uniref:BTB domain-containing protein n=1 Tax=Nephila pilipes TaxID=299642 RepID=A0A8X6MP73_NEPPI|nr:hypothetical protein NPIL_320301 [Nephila pilipes]